METKSRHAKIEMQVEPRDAQANHWKYGERTPIYIDIRDARVYKHIKELLYTQMRPPQRTTEYCALSVAPVSRCPYHLSV